MHSHFHSANPKRPSWDDSWKWVSTMTLIGTSPTYWKIKIFIPMKEGRPSGAKWGLTPSPYTMICQKHKPHNVGSKVMHDWVKWPPNCLVLVPYPSQNWTTSWIPKSMTYYFYSPSCKKSHHLHSHAAERYFTVIFHILWLHFSLHSFYLPCLKIGDHGHDERKEEKGMKEN